MSMIEYKKHVQTNHATNEQFEELNENTSQIQKSLRDDMSMSKKMIEELNRTLKHKIE